MKIIAESAYNHNGDLNYLKELALAAQNAKVDLFTVQVMDLDLDLFALLDKTLMINEKDFFECFNLEEFLFSSYRFEE